MRDAEHVGHASPRHKNRHVAQSVLNETVGATAHAPSLTWVVRQTNILQMAVPAQHARDHHRAVGSDLIPLEEEFSDASLTGDEGIAEHAQDRGIDARSVEVDRRDGLVEIFATPWYEGSYSLVLDPFEALRGGIVRERQADLDEGYCHIPHFSPPYKRLRPLVRWEGMRSSFGLRRRVTNFFRTGRGKPGSAAGCVGGANFDFNLTSIK
jgi:hypothetical protein